MNTPRAHTLRLLLGDQLNPQHSWFATRDDGVVYVLMLSLYTHLRAHET